MPTIPPAVPATPGGAWPPADQSKPQDKQRRRLSTRARIIAGAAVGVVLILVLVVVITANSGTAPPSAGVAGMTTSPATKGVIFQDDFSDRTSGWDDAGGKRTGGHYTNGAYRIYAPPVPDGGSEESYPWKASNIYPSAPDDVRIEVAAHRLTRTGMEDTGYGIICRNGENTGGYEFTLGNDYVNIAKFSNTSPDWAELTSGGLPEIDGNATNRLEAVCTTEGQQAVHLVFLVNGKKVAEATDTKNPYPTGTVGLFAGTGPEANMAIEAEFDDFAVSQI